MTPAAPLAVYIHWPYCARICPYCDFNVVKARGGPEPAALARAIVADLTAHAGLTGPRTLASIFLGGGTPSLMDPAWAAEIIAAARSLWSPAHDLEVSLEANPTDAEAARFAALRAAGVERLSLGVQALDDASLRFLGRNHGADEALRAAELAARTFPRLSVDLIYARPGQSAGAWAEELARAVAIGAEHISPYQLTIEPGTAFDAARRRGRLVPPDPDLAADLFETTQEVLGAAGFEAYEVSNHARWAAAQSRHNLAYWRGAEYVGVGPGAHGRLDLDGVRTATVAARGIGEYIATVAATGLGLAEREPLAPGARAEERLLSGLRVAEGVALEEVAALDLPPGRVAALVADGLLADDPMRLRATAAGRQVLDSLTLALCA